jgi:ubiquinone biosynthesis protein UbiJ
MMLNPGSILQAAFNHVLEQDEWARAELKRHVGKCACFEIDPLVLRFKIDADGLVAVGQATLASSVIIRMRLADLPLLVQNQDQMFSYVHIEGDADFANTISQVGRSVKWDMADDLSKLVGDIAAQRIVETTTGAMRSLQSTQRAVMENVAEYFLEEKPMLVRPSAVSDFSDDVIRLRDDIERLAKRFERLERNI